MNSRYNDIRKQLREQFESIPGDLLDEVIVQVDEHFNGAGRPRPGDEVSVDVSTCDEDAGRRVFATIESSQPDPAAPRERIWLARMSEDNFDLIGKEGASTREKDSTQAPEADLTDVMWEAMVGALERHGFKDSRSDLGREQYQAAFQAALGAVHDGEVREQHEAIFTIPEGMAWSEGDQDYRIFSDEDFWCEKEGQSEASHVRGRWEGFKAAWQLARHTIKAKPNKLALNSLIEAARCLGATQDSEAGDHWEAKIREYRQALESEGADSGEDWIPCSERLPDVWQFCDWLYPPSDLKNERRVLVGEAMATASVPGEATHWRAHNPDDWPALQYPSGVTPSE